MRLLTILLFLPLLTTAQKRMSSSFEAGLTDSITFVETCCSYSFTKSAHRSFVGNFSARFEQRRGDAPVTTGGIRSEINVNSTNTLPDRYDARWWKFSTYIPSDSNAVDLPGLNYIMGQIKQPGTGGVQTGGSPPLGIVVDEDSVFAWIRWATTSQPNSDNPSNGRRLYIGPRGVDQWVHYVIDYQRSHTPSGVVRIWRNDILVVNDTGRNYFEGAAFPSYKWGLYNYRWASPPYQGSIVPYRVLYLDAIGVYGASSTYEEVATFRATSNPPVVAVPNYTTTNSSITLTASVTSDNPIVDYSWLGLTGPNTPSVSVPAAGQLTLSGLVNGVYTYQITVTDSEGQTDSAVSTITKVGTESTIKIKKKIKIIK